MSIATTNPATGEIVKTFESLTAEELDSKLTLAVEAFSTHRRSTFEKRAEMMNRAWGADQ